MAEIQLARAVNGPGTHALVVGVSHYPYLDGPQQTDEGRSYGLTDLSTAARSAAEVARWLLEEHRNPAAPLASLFVLLSPADGEALPDAVASRLPASFAATSTAVRHDLLAFRERCRARTDNVAFVYIAGHGVQLTKRGATVLLEDFAGPGQLNVLDGAIDMVSCHGGFNGTRFAANQAWFVDACRLRPAIAARFDEVVGGLTLDEPIGQVESSPLYLASSSREAAFATPGAMTLFSTALLEALRGAAAKGPDATCEEWHVSVYGLGELLTRRVRELAGESGEEQRVDVTGRVNEAVIHRFEQAPEVDLRLELDPTIAAQYCKASLYLGREEVVSAATEWPLVRRVKAGLYSLRVDAEAPYRGIPGLAEVVRPPTCLWPVRVT